MVPPAHSTPAHLQVVVMLLDPTSDRPMKTWRFDGMARIAIGRDDAQDVEISDPYVSRSHAELEWRGGAWVLVSRGRYGVIVENELITEMPIDGEVTFRLGASGPRLRFRPAAALNKTVQTLYYETMPEDSFQLNGAKLQSDLEEITESDYFQKLQKKARDLRRNRDDR